MLASSPEGGAFIQFPVSYIKAPSLRELAKPTGFD